MCSQTYSWMPEGKSMTNNYTIAVCDILGFSHLVQENPLDHIVQGHLAWLRKALHHSIHREKFPGEVPSLQVLRNQSALGLAWFSDTILIYTLEDTDDKIRALTSSLGWLLFETMFTVGTRLRCGVSYGEAHIDTENSIYVGNSLIEAYRLEQAQVWSGGALTPQAAERLPVMARTGKYYADWFLVPYQIPVKDNKIVKMVDSLAIDWTIGLHGPLDFRWSGTDAEPPADAWKTRPDIYTKWQYTKQFHNSICRTCRC